MFDTYFSLSTTSEKITLLHGDASGYGSGATSAFEESVFFKVVEIVFSFEQEWDVVEDPAEQQVHTGLGAFHWISPEPSSVPCHNMVDCVLFELCGLFAFFWITFLMCNIKWCLWP